MLRIIGPREKFNGHGAFVNTTSRSDCWSRGLSPFFLGPVTVPYGPTRGMIEKVERLIAAGPDAARLTTLNEVRVAIAGSISAHNVENAWQYSKVFDGYDMGGEPIEGWFQWRFTGFQQRRAVRYPMGKGASTLYSWYDGKRMTYIEARKNIYIPLYSGAVRDTDAFRRLQGLYTAGDLTLWDFDGYDHHALGMSLHDVVECQTRKMGHAFVLAMMLEGLI